MKKVLLYTDGACSGNPGIGGWGAILIYNGIEKICSGSEQETTNNRMEITAVIRGLQALKEGCEVEIYSDSAYVVNSFSQGWIDNWLKNNWKSSKGQVLNVDLWKGLLKECAKHKVSWIKVKGHADNEYNNRCDKLAREEINKLKKSMEEN